MKTSVRNNTNQKSADLVPKKQQIISLQKDGKNIKIKKEGVARKNLDLRLPKAKEGAPKTASPQRNAPETTKAKLSGAIFERDEADEEDTIDSYHQRQHSNTQENQEPEGTTEEFVDHGNSNMTNQEAQHILSESSRMLNDRTNMTRVYRFRPSNIVTSDIMAETKETNANSAKSPTGVRGAFMNEHITLTDMEKQKEKQRQMREALDFQLNEKKRKQEEEKMREREENVREEQRIKREIEQLKLQREKEAITEGKKHIKIEDSDQLASPQLNLRINTTTQLEKFDKMRKETPLSGCETIDSPLGKKSRMSPAKVTRAIEPLVRDTAEIKMSPAKVTRAIEPLIRDTADIRVSTVESKNAESLYTLADENKKLRDENSKKEELIDALIHALKTKGSNNTSNMQGIPPILTNSSVEQNTPYSSKPVKAVNIFDTESDSYGYYLNGYAQSRSRIRAISEQHSDVRRQDSRDMSYTLNDDKNYSIINYEQAESRDYEPKSSKLRLEYISEPMKSMVPNPNSMYKLPAFVPNARANDPLSFAGSTVNSRILSSPLTSYMTKSLMSASGYKPENKSVSYVAPLNPVTNGHVILEPIKTATHSNLSFLRSTHMSPQNISSNEDSFARNKSKYDHSFNTNEQIQESKFDPRATKSYRPVMNIIREDGAFSLAKPGKSSKKESISIPHPSSSPVNGSLPVKRYDITEVLKKNSREKTSSKVGSFSSNQGGLEPVQEIDIYSGSQFRLLTKLNAFAADSEKKSDENYAQKEKWASNEVTPVKRSSREELLEKVKALPVLDSKPKFPKEVFSFSLKKKVYP